MKILYICDKVNLKDGWGVVNYHTIKNAVEHFSKVSVATHWNADNLPIEGVTYLPVLKSLRDDKLKSLALVHDGVRIHKLKRKVSVVHILIEPYLPLARCFADKKLLFEIHGTYSVVSFEGINRRLYYKGLNYVNHVVSNSHYTANMFVSASGYTGPLDVLGLGVDIERFKLCSIGKKEKSALFVGAIKPRKGLLYVIRAMSKVCETEPLAKLYVIGQTHVERYYKDCIATIKALGLENDIVFVGRVGDESLKAYYDRCCVNVLPSVNEGNAFEGFGLTHLEANACGIPSIGSYGCGNEDAIIHGETGFLCKPKDIDGLAGAILSIFNILDSEEFRKLQERCRRHAEQNSWKLYFVRLLKIYCSASD